MVLDASNFHHNTKFLKKKKWTKHKTNFHFSPHSLNRKLNTTQITRLSIVCWILPVVSVSTLSWRSYVLVRHPYIELELTPKISVFLVVGEKPKKVQLTRTDLLNRLVLQWLLWLDWRNQSHSLLVDDT